MCVCVCVCVCMHVFFSVSVCGNVPWEGNLYDFRRQFDSKDQVGFFCFVFLKDRNTGFLSLFN